MPDRGDLHDLSDRHDRRGLGVPRRLGDLRDLRELWPLLRSALCHPTLWPVMMRMVPPGWWKGWPPLPVPPASYTSFRLETMYGPAAGPVDQNDMIRYLEWCRRMGSPAR
jgi:hypothetical protein